jgi:5-formyltetrahydrofolate cyclo-ligase
VQFGVFLKSVIRSEVLSHLQGLSLEEKTKSSFHIQNYLKQELKSQSGIWAGYRSLNDEPSVEWSEVASHIKWVFPVTKQDSLEFRTAETEFKKSEFGVQEPVGGNAVPVSEISGFVIPALGYDKEGYRLGRGRGYYDRTVAQTKSQKIGVCFQVSIFENIPFESHDLRCDKIITEKQVYHVSKAEGEQKWN